MRLAAVDEMNEVSLAMSLLILISTVLVLEYILRAHPVPAARNVAPLPSRLTVDDPGHQAITTQLLDAAQALDRQGRGPAPPTFPPTDHRHQPHTHTRCLLFRAKKPIV